jgi:hypothetical protein
MSEELSHDDILDCACTLGAHGDIIVRAFSNPLWIDPEEIDFRHRVRDLQNVGSVINEGRALCEDFRQVLASILADRPITSLTFEDLRLVAFRHREWLPTGMVRWRGLVSRCRGQPFRIC